MVSTCAGVSATCFAWFLGQVAGPCLITAGADTLKSYVLAAALPQVADGIPYI